MTKNNFFELIFPKFCVGCGIEGIWLCPECESKILPVVTQVCPGCGRISEFGVYCELCRYDITFKKIKGKKKPVKVVKRKPLQGIITAAYYEEGPIREIIHHFKYNSVTELKKPLADLINKALIENLDIENSLKIKNCKIENYILTYAPLHFRRLAQRGYNQSELLAKEIGARNKLQVSKLLVKTKKTKRQVELTGKRRRENLRKVFKVCKVHQVRKVIKNKNILIIDDISTTGATLNECAKVLKEAGAKKVWGLVVARG